MKLSEMAKTPKKMTLSEMAATPKTTTSSLGNVLLKNVKAGAVSALNAPGKIAQNIGLTKFLPSVFDMSDEIAREEQLKQEAAQATENYGGNTIGGKAVRNVIAPLAQTIPALAGDAALMLGTGGASAAPNLVSKLAPKTVQAASAASNLLKQPVAVQRMTRYFSDEYDKALKGGASQQEALANGIIYSVPSALIESAGGVDSVVRDVLGKQTKTTVGKLVKDTLLKAAPQEGAEEVLQGLTEGVANKLTFDKSKPLTGQGGVIDPARMTQEFGVGFAGGALLGGGISGVNAAAGNIAGKAKPQTTPITPLKTEQPIAQKADILTGLQEKAMVADNASAQRTKISKTRTNTIEKATAISDEARAQMPFSDFDYIPETKVEWADQAAANIANNKAKVIADLNSSKAISGGVQSHEAALLTQEMMAEARKTGDYSQVKNFLKDTVVPKTRETARALKAVDTAWDKKTAEGAIIDAARVVDKVEETIKKVNPNKLIQVGKEAEELTKAVKSNDQQKIIAILGKPRQVPTEPKSLYDKVTELVKLGAYTDEKALELIKQKKGIPVLTNDDVKFITETMDKAASLTQGSYEERALRAKIALLIQDKNTTSIVDKFRAAVNASLLTNSMTMMINNTSNLVFGIADDFANIISPSLAKIIKPEIKTHALPSVGTQLKGARRGIVESLQDAAGGLTAKELKGKSFQEKARMIWQGMADPINTGMTGAEKYEGTMTLAFRNKMLRRVENIARMFVTDRPFEQAHYDDVLRQLMKANQTKTPTQEMIEVARKVADERTYRDSNAISTLALWLRNAPTKALGNESNVGKVLQILVNSKIPFVKTPANLVKRGLEYTPAGIVEGLVKLGVNSKLGTLNMASKREIIDRLSRGIVGSVLIGLGYGAKSVTGKEKDDYDLARYEQQLGRSATAIKLGDNYFTYGRLQPLSFPLTVGATTRENRELTSGDLVDVILAVEDAMNLAMEEPIFQSFQDIFGNQYGNKGIGEKLVGGVVKTPQMLVPFSSGLNQLRKVTDPYQRELHSDNYLMKNLVNPVVNKLPGLSKTLPVKPTLEGKDSKLYQGRNNFFNIFVNPTQKTEFKPNAIQQEIIRLYDEGGSTIQVPTIVDRYINATKEHPRIDLTGKEYAQYQRRTGELTQKRFADVMKRGEYINASPTKTETADEVRAKMLQSAITKAKAEAKLEILNARGYKK